MIGLVHFLFLLLLAICAYMDFKTRKVADAFVLVGMVLVLALSPSQFEFQVFIGVFITAWFIAIVAPKSLAWADVTFLPSLVVFCVSLFSLEITFPFYLAMAAFIAINYEKLKKPYPMFVLFFYAYLVIIVSTILLPFYPRF